MPLEIVDGDLLDQNVEAIVNAWNRNIIPWWLLLPQGVSGAIKKRGGTEPFREAVLTGAGKLPFRGIIHVAGINMLWRASEYSIRQSAQNAMRIVNKKRVASVAFPVLGAGSGGLNESRALELLHDELSKIETPSRVLIVRFRPEKTTPPKVVDDEKL